MDRFLRAVTFVALAIGLPGIATAQDQTVRPAKVAVVQSSETVFERRYPAIVQPSAEAVLSFRVSGRVVELPVKASAKVKEGDVIAKLDPRDFETQIAQLESQRDQALSQLNALRSGARAEEIVALEAGIDAIGAQVDQAREQADRSRQLFEKDLVASAQLEADQTALRVAEAELRAKLEELTIARSGGRKEEVESAEAALRGLESQIQNARDNLADATLRAPFDGIIARRDIDNFTNIQAGQDIVLLQRLETVHLEFDVPGQDVVRFAGFDPTSTVTLAAAPDAILDAQLVEFSTQADAATQTYRGHVSVTVPAGTAILPGMVGTVFVTIAESPTAGLTIPLNAVGANTDGSPFVWIVGDGNKVSKSAVTLGDVSGDSVTVTDGVSAGDTVVTAGVTQIRDGMQIRPITKIGG